MVHGGTSELTTNLRVQPYVSQKITTSTDAQISNFYNSKMPSLVSSKYDANKAYPLSKNYAKNPNPDPFRLCYHRFLDSTGTEHEIFVPPGKEREIIELDENKDWDALMNFPAFSDRPPVSSMQPNCVSVPMGAGGSMVSFYIPEDEGKNDRVCELVSVEDYQTLEREFEPWGKYLWIRSPARSLCNRHITKMRTFR
jgi:hypothetical protein